MHRFSSRGISLIELILYIGILSFVMVILADLFSGVLRTKSVTDSKVEVSSNLRFAADRMTGEIRKALDILSPTTDTPVNTLCIKMTSSTTTVFKYNSSTSALDMITGVGLDCVTGGTTSQLTTSLVLVDISENNIFTLVNNLSPAKKTIKIILKIKYNDAGRPTLQYSDSIKTTVSLR